MTQPIEKMDRSVQVEELFRKAFFPKPYDLTPWSDLHPPEKSQPDFALDTFDDEIAPKLVCKKQRVQCSSSRSTAKNRLLSGSFVNVVKRQPPVGYEDKMVLIGKPIDATSELLPALRLLFRT